MKTESLHADGKVVSSAVKILSGASKETPAAAIVLGSGVSVLTDLTDSITLSYADVFGISPTIAGHAGSLTIGRMSTQSPLIAVLRGRFHLYEGHEWSVVTLPTRVIVEWGVPSLLLTNAAGGLNQSFGVGDLMLLTGYRDHMSPQWVDKGLLPAIMQPVFDCRNALSEKVLLTAELLHEYDPGFLKLQQGTYAGLLGPCYETMAEIEMLRKLKADAVGMSTVPELQTVKGTATEAAAISVITNVWSDEPIGGHEEVLQAAKAASRRLDKLFTALLQ